MTRSSAVLERPASARPRTTPPARWHALVAASLGILFDAMDASIYFMVLYPALSELLKTSNDTEIGVCGSLVLAVFMVGWALGSFVFGIVADHIGRVRTMVITILLYAVSTGLCALSHSWQELAFYRFLVGLGIGGEISIGAVMLGESWNGRGRIYATSMMELAFCLGFLATSVVNLSLGHSTWRWLFLVGIVPALLTLYIRMKLKEPDNFEHVKLARRQLEEKRANERTPDDLTLGKASAIEIFSGSVLGRTVIITTLAGVAIVGYWAAVAWIPAWVNQLTGTLAVEERSTAGIVLNVGGIVSCIVAPGLIFNLGRRNTLILSYAGSLLSTVLMFLIVKSYGPELLCWVFAVGFFTCIPFTVVCVLLPELFATRMLGTASGFAFSAGRLVAAAAAVFGAHVIAGFGGSYAAAGASVGLVYAAGCIASFFLPAGSGDVAGVDTHKDLVTAKG